MFKTRKQPILMLLILLPVLLYANIGAVAAECSGGYFGYGPTATGESTELPDPSGLLRVTSMPYIYRNELTTLVLTITNQMPSDQSLHNGYFSLEFQYTPVGGNPDGSDDIIVAATADVEVGELLSGQSMNASFAPGGTIPLDRWDSLKCKLYYYGFIGRWNLVTFEKEFSPGILLFNESWDNGLTGNYAWYSSPPGQNPDNGTSYKNVLDGNLIMQLTRFSGETTARTNDLAVTLTGGANPNGIPVTPNTHIQFVIDEMTSSTTDTTQAAHFMDFVLSDGTNYYQIQYSDAGPYLAGGEIYVDFTPGVLTTNNIHQLLLEDGITPPSELFLVKIGFLQQVFGQSDPVQINLNMDVDAVRVIEQSDQ